MNKNFLAILGAILILLIGYFFLSSRQATSPTKEALPEITTAVDKTTAGEKTDQAVTYTNEGFSSKSLKIKVGDTVAFTNQSEGMMWIASDPHPVHTNLPGFDQLKGVETGGIYRFTFDKPGSWGYHNHLSPNDKGTVIVE